MGLVFGFGETLKQPGFCEDVKLDQCNSFLDPARVFGHTCAPFLNVARVPGILRIPFKMTPLFLYSFVEELRGGTRANPHKTLSSNVSNVFTVTVKREMGQKEIRVT